MIIGLITLGFAAGFSCPGGIGASAGDPPKQVYMLSGAPDLALCGWQSGELEGDLIFSEFELVNTQTRDIFLRFGAVQEFSVDAEEGRVLLTEYKNYPVNTRFEWERRPYRQLEVRANQEGNYTCVQRLVFEPPAFSEQDRRLLLEQYEAVRETGHPIEGLAELITQAAMGGDERFVSLLPGLRAELHLDGHFAEEFTDVRRIYDEQNSGRGAKECSSPY